MKEYACLEYGCEFVAMAEGNEELVRLVQKHVSEQHSSFEIEDFILASATEVDDRAGRATRATKRSE